MPVTLDQLAAAMHQFLSGKLPGAGGDAPGSVVLVFDGFGTPLEPGEFGAGATDSQQQLLAHQRAAQLADQLPAAAGLANGWYIARTGSRLSRWYHTALADSVGISGAGPDAFDKHKAAALNELDDNQLIEVGGVTGSGGTVDPTGVHDSYYATGMSPTNWFLLQADSWESHHIDDAALAPAALQAIAPVHAGLPLPTWTLTTAATRSALLGPPMEETGLLAAERLAPEPAPSDGPPPDEGTGERLRALQEEGLLVALTQRPAPAGGPPPADGTAFDREVLQSPLPVLALFCAEWAGPCRRMGPLLDQIASSYAKRLRVVKVDVDGDQAAAARFDVRSVPTLALFMGGRLIDRLLGIPSPDRLTAFIEGHLVPPRPPLGFTVDFDYCMMTFDRPWWDEVFLASSGWTVPGFSRGQIGSGSASHPSEAAITLITTGMVVIRNLRLTAGWSDQDRQAVTAAGASMGPFSLTGAVFEGQTLTRAGMQAAAWICQVPPVLPPS
jgi:thiol-disulfide isomerase/thioredoxin